MAELAWKVEKGALLAPAGIVTCFLLMYGLPVETWERLAIWMALGLAIYVAYGRRHSRIGAAIRDRRK